MNEFEKQIITVRAADNQLYTIPAELVERWDDGKALVRFAAGNMRLVELDLLTPASDADRQEFVTARAIWKN